MRKKEIVLLKPVVRADMNIEYVWTHSRVVVLALFLILVCGSHVERYLTINITRCLLILPKRSFSFYNAVNIIYILNRYDINVVVGQREQKLNEISLTLYIILCIRLKKKGY